MSGSVVSRQHASQAGQLATRTIQTEAASVREKRIHAAKPAPHLPPCLPHGERLIIRRALFPSPRFQSSTLVEELSSRSLFLLHYAGSFSPLSPTLPIPLSSLQRGCRGGSKPSGGGGRWGARRGGGGELLCFLGVNERTGRL